VAKRQHRDQDALRQRRTSVTKLTERLNSPEQGTGADGLKLALVLLHERRDGCPGAVPILAVHDEVVVECDEADVEAVAAWLEEAMKDGMGEVLALGARGAAKVPVEVEVKSGKTWASGLPCPPPAPEHDEEEEPAMAAHLDDGPVPVKVYVDYRDPSADAYPEIDVCDGCAEAFGAGLGEADHPRPDEAAWCEICSTENPAAARL
jgi:hypothetical protein